MDEWRQFTLDELYEFASGLSKPRSEFGSGYPFLSFKDVFYNYFVPRNLTSLVRSDDKDRSRCSVRRGDVFLTRTSETMDELGMSCVALRDIPDATFNGFTKRLRPKSEGIVLPEYAGYFFRSYKFREEVKSMTTMATRASLNNEMLARLTMTVPPANVQSAISKMLLALDDKIELNRKTVVTLEAMARALYRSWFVDFDPVHSKAAGRAPAHMDEATAALFPDSFGEDGLPEGWKVSEIGQELDILDSMRIPLSRPQREARVGTIPYYGATSVMGYVDEAIFDEILLLVGEDGSVVRPDGKPFTQYIWGKSWVNNHAHALRGVRFSVEQLKCFFDQVEISPFVNGAVQAKLNQGNMKKIPFVEAYGEVHSAFDQTIQPWFSKIRLLSEQNQTLATLRDTLLPRLMSGELRVGEAREQVKEMI